MGCLSAIYGLVARNGLDILDFNKAPYSMGSFSDILSKNSKSKSFELGILLEQANIRYDFRFEEEYEGAESIIDKIDIAYKDIVFSCKRNGVC